MTTLNASLSTTKRLGSACQTRFDTNEENAVPLSLSLLLRHTKFLRRNEEINLEVNKITCKTQGFHRAIVEDSVFFFLGDVAPQPLKMKALRFSKHLETLT